MKSKNLAKILESHGYQIVDMQEPRPDVSYAGFVTIKTTEESDLWVSVGFDFYGVSYTCLSGQVDLPAIDSDKLMSINNLLNDIQDAIRHIETEETVAKENGGELPLGWCY